MCRQKDAKTVQGCALKTRSPCCAGYGFRFFGYEKSESVLHADGLKKSLRRIFIAAALERRTANHLPCPLLRGGELRGRKANNLRSAAWLSANPNIPRAPNCRLDFISPSEPLSRHRERGWGERADALRLPWERICAQYGFRFFVGEKSKSVSSTASDWGLGAEPQACFGSFYTSKRNAPAASRTNCNLI